MNLKKLFLKYCTENQFEINQSQIDTINNLRDLWFKKISNSFLLIRFLRIKKINLAFLLLVMWALAKQ